MLERLKEMFKPEKDNPSRVRSTNKRVLSWSSDSRTDDVSLRATFEEGKPQPSIRVSVKPWRDFRKKVYLNRNDLDGLVEFFVEVLEEREKRNGETK